MKIAMKAKMWFGGDVAEAECKMHGDAEGHIAARAALYADIEGCDVKKSQGHARQEV
jgi:hypothetical protein